MQDGGEEFIEAFDRIVRDSGGGIILNTVAYLPGGT